MAVGSVGSEMMISGLNVSFPEGDERASSNRDLANWDRSATLLSDNEPYSKPKTDTRVNSNDTYDLMIDLSCSDKKETVRRVELS